MTDFSRLLVLTDLDGTFLPKSKQIAPEDLQSIRRFQAAGGRFTLATGRTLEAAAPYLAQVAPNAPAILYNGAMIFDPIANRPLQTTCLPPESVGYLRELLAVPLDIGAEILRADGTYIVQLNDSERSHVQVCGVTPHYTTPAEMSPDGWLKVLFALPPADVDRLEAYTQSHPFPGVDFVRSERIFLEMLPAGISKGAALANRRALFAAPDCFCIAAGDFHNDLELLAAADLGVCPSNAQPVVRDAASLVLPDSCETHAIPRLLEALLRGETFGFPLPRTR